MTISPDAGVVTVLAWLWARLTFRFPPRLTLGENREDQTRTSRSASLGPLEPREAQAAHSLSRQSNHPFLARGDPTPGRRTR